MGRVRTCTAADLPAALALCAQDPVANLFVASRLAKGGIERHTLGCDVLGYEVDGRLVSLLHQGANLVPVAAGDDAIAAFVEAQGRWRGSSSIMGPAEQVMPLYRALVARWGPAWANPREKRPDQPLMVIAGEPAVEPEPRVERIGVEHLESYFRASVAMYTEEVGVSPLGPDDSYRNHVRATLRDGRGYGILSQGQVRYKSDVGARHGGVAQIQGVWLHPELRGRGLAPRAMAGVVDRVRRHTPTVSLYVNSFNAPALATYRRVGFEQVGTFATILY